MGREVEHNRTGLLASQKFSPVTNSEQRCERKRGWACSLLKLVHRIKRANSSEHSRSLPALLCGDLRQTLCLLHLHWQSPKLRQTDLSRSVILVTHSCDHTHRVSIALRVMIGVISSAATLVGILCNAGALYVSAVVVLCVHGTCA
jgi:hypothetical protein